MENPEKTAFDRILIVDDQLKNIQVLGTILMDSGFEVVVAMSGPEALDAAGQSAPNLILLDIMMPEMDGFEVCERLIQNEHTRDIPIIFLTAKTEVEDITRAFDIGAVDYITKPFNQSELLARVKTHLSLKKSSEIAELNCELRKAKNFAESVSNAKSRFMQNLSHELRTPLNSIISALSLFEGLDLPDDCHELLGIIGESSETLATTVENVLELSGNDDSIIYADMSPFRLDQLLSKIENKSVHKGISKHFNLKFNIDESSVPNYFIGFPDIILKVLNNIIDNGVKFNKNNPPTIIIHIQSREIDAEKAELAFSVIDNGIGIDQENVDLIFEPFIQLDSSLKKSYDGVGMGLPTSKRYVSFMGGSIRLESEIDKGSRFTFSVILDKQKIQLPFDKRLLKSSPETRKE